MTGEARSWPRASGAALAAVAAGVVPLAGSAGCTQYPVDPSWFEDGGGLPATDGIGTDGAGRSSGIAAVGPCAGRADGSPCEDGDACTVGDACLDGVCSGGANDPCDGEGPCRPGTCVPGAGCVYEDHPDGTPCAVACFLEGSCGGGKCLATPGTEVVCPSPDADRPCVLSLHCEGSTGACTHEVFRPTGAACDLDGNLCTLETCDGGGDCQPTGEVETCVSAAKTDPCWTWDCAPLTGECLPQVFLEAGPCDDGNPCTWKDACGSHPLEPKLKVCLGATLPSDDGNPCTADTCTGGLVTHSPLSGVACPTGDFCTPSGLCDDALCTYEGCVCVTDADCAGVPAGPPAACLVSICDPSTLHCTSSKAPDGAACDDANPCTVETCVSGICAGAPIACDDGDPCTDETCLDGACVPHPIDCDDGDPCTLDGCGPSGCVHAPADCEDGDLCTVDLCKGAVCLHEPFACDDGDPCTADACNGTGCSAPPLSCDDGDPCTVDTCAGGVCSHAPIACDDDDACTVDACDDGACLHAPLPCEDGDPCTAGACVDGLCAHAPLDCEDGDPCTIDTCLGGSCHHAPLDCADGDPCTADGCQDGVCTFAPLPCDDGDACTVDGCGALGCEHDLLECADLDPCTIDTCQGGACVHSSFACDDGDPRTEDACEDNACSTAPISCDDGDACTSDACKGGLCDHEPALCEDGDPCTLDACADGACLHPVVDCSDGDPCTADSCEGGACSHGPATCDDGDPCTDDLCAGGACLHSPLACSDGDPCTSDLCSGGACDHPALDCEDGDPCTVDACAGGACVHPPLDCSDGDACTVDACSFGACVHPPLDCEDGDPCTVETCAGGACGQAPLDCSDGDACTADACAGGECLHPTLDCSDGDACTVDACSDGACVHPPLDCEDGDLCTVDSCVDGECVNPALDCQDANLCTEDVCDGGVCLHPELDCDDGDLCTVDACSKGQCYHPSIGCTDGDACTVDSCDEGECFHEPLGCGDGNPCTVDACAGGVCGHTPLACDDGEPCTVDACKPALGGCTFTKYACLDDDDPCTTRACKGDGTCKTVPLVPPVTRIWVGDDGDWHEPWRWDPPGVPCGADYAVVNQDGAEVTTSAPIRFLTLHVGGTVPSKLTLSQPTLNEYGALTVADFGTLLLDGKTPWTIGALLVTGDGVVAHAPENANGVSFHVLGDALVDGTIEVSGLGKNPLGNDSGKGGSHGGTGGGIGWGGAVPPPALGTKVHGLLLAPAALGSHGNYNAIVRGGGRVRLEVEGTLTIDGALLARGVDVADTSSTCAGSGGSIHLTASALAGQGLVSARGGGAGYAGGAGGGGRVAVEGDVSGWSAFVDVSGGSAQMGGPGRAGTWVVNMTEASHFAFVTGPESQSVVGAAEPFVVELRDAAGGPVVVQGAPLDVELASTSATASFSPWPNFAKTVDRIAIPVGGSTALFYYRDTKAGAATITAGGPVTNGIAKTTRKLDMLPGPAATLAVTSEHRTVPTGVPTAPIVFERRDFYGNVTGEGSLAISMASDSLTGRFGASPDGPFDGSFVSLALAPGQTSAAVHYLDPEPGVFTIFGSSPNAGVASQKVLVVEGPDLHIWIGKVGPWDDPTRWDVGTVPSAGSTVVVNQDGSTVQPGKGAPETFAKLLVGSTTTSVLEAHHLEGGALIVAAKGMVKCRDTPLTVQELTVEKTGWVAVVPGPSFGIDIHVTGDATVAGPIYAQSGMDPMGKSPGFGGSHGGRGGGASAGTLAASNTVHGHILDPFDPGSAGLASNGQSKAEGGTRIRLVVGGTLDLPGTIQVGGGYSGTWDHPGGSGGSIDLECGSLVGGGTILANGGSGGPKGGGGGGGRVAIDADVSAYDVKKVNVDGGPGGSGGASNGEAGTFVLNMGHAARFDFLDFPGDAAGGELTGPVTIQLQDDAGEPVPVGGKDLAVELSSTKVGTEFFAGPAGGAAVDRVFMKVGESEVQFWFRVPEVPKPSLCGITAGGPVTYGIEPPTGNLVVTCDCPEEVVVDRVVLVNEPWTFPAGVASPAFTARRLDAAGEPVAEGETFVFLGSTSPLGTFSAPDGVLVFPDGASEVSFTYTDPVAGEPVVFLEDPVGVFEGDEQVALVVEGPDLHIWRGGTAGWHDPTRWDPPSVPKATSTVYLNQLGATVTASSEIAFAFLQVGGTVATTLVAGSAAGGDLRVDGTGTFVQTGGTLSVGTLTLDAAGLLTHDPESSSGVDVAAADVVVEGTVDASGRAWGALGSAPQKGGSHGGRGGASGALGVLAPPALVHGSLLAPSDLGAVGTSAGGNVAGGGRVRIQASGNVHVSGSILADGAGASSLDLSGGSGGSVHLQATALTGSGLLRARGGAGKGTGGGGGGGRISLDANDSGFEGTFGVEGGKGGAGGTGGEAGTLAIGMSAAVRFAVASPPGPFSAVGTSEPVVVELVDAAGSPVVVKGAPLAVELASTSPTATFSATADFAAKVDRVFVPIGASSAAFWIRDTKAGTSTLTLGGPVAGGIEPATADLLVVPGPTYRLTITTETVNAVAGQPSQPLTVERQDLHFNPTVGPALPFLLASASPTGTFSADAAGTFEGGLPAFLIPDGASSVDLFYADTTLGTPLVEVADPEGLLLGDAVEVNVVLDASEL